MTTVKSLSVGNGDMFYIKHGSDSFSIIDCCMSEEDKAAIVDEIKAEARYKGIRRFISTHPDDDHIRGLQFLDDEISIRNFYCVKNNATKADVTVDFRRYRELRDSKKKAFYLFKSCLRRWMNRSDEKRRQAGIEILWPVVENPHYQEALKQANNEGSPNNICPIIKYSLQNGVTMLWMGDLETDFMQKITSDVDVPPADILFAPHHGRDSGKVPQKWLNNISPSIVVIGEAPAAAINYYAGYNTITQNSADNITFECEAGKVHIYVSKSGYSVTFLHKEHRTSYTGYYYIGTLYTKA